MKTILQIEDDRANRLLIERVLERFDYRLIHAVDGESGIQTAIEQKPDLVLIDIGLPDIDGHTVLTMLKQIPDLGHSRFVALTAWPEDMARQMCERYGYDGCITKPITVADFPSQIAAFFDGE